MTESTRGQADEIIAKLTPQRLLALVREMLARPRTAGERAVPVYEVIDELVAGRGFDARAKAILTPPLKSAIIQMLDQAPELEFVGGG